MKKDWNESMSGVCWDCGQKYLTNNQKKRVGVHTYF